MRRIHCSVLASHRSSSHLTANTLFLLTITSNKSPFLTLRIHENSHYFYKLASNYNDCHFYTTLTANIQKLAKSLEYCSWNCTLGKFSGYRYLHNVLLCTGILLFIMLYLCTSDSVILLVSESHFLYTS